MDRSRRAEQLIAAALAGLLVLGLGASLAAGVADPAAPPPPPARDGAVGLGPESRTAPVAHGGTAAGIAPLRLLTVTGRCVDADDGRPLAACEVALAAGARPGTGRHCGGTRDAMALRSDREGRFAAELALGPDEGVHVAAVRTGHARVAGWSPVPDGTALCLGDVALPPGTALRARVLDEDGAPLAGVAVHFERQLPAAAAATAAPAIGFSIAPAAEVAATSDGNGWLAASEPLACGSWRVRLPGHHRLLRPTGPSAATATATVAVTADTWRQPLELVVRLPRPTDSITGTVAGAGGAPVADAEVRAVGLGAAPAVTDARGAFRLARPPGADGSVHLHVRRAAGCDDLQTPAPLAWGSRDVALVLQRAGRVLATVVAAPDGRPVEHFAIGWFQAPGGGLAPHGSFGAPARHPDGRAVLEGVPRGPVHLIVTPADPALVPSGPVAVEHRVDGTAVRIALRRAGELPVQVAFADGRPVAGTVVELLEPPPQGTVEMDTPVRDAGALAAHGGRHPFARRIDRATTDGRGRAVLRGPAGGPPLALRALGPLHLPALRRDVVLVPRTEPVVLPVDAGAALSGTVGPGAILAAVSHGSGPGAADGQGPMLVLTWRGRRQDSGGPARRTVRLDAAGRFCVAGLQPGPWSVLFCDRRLEPDALANPRSLRLPDLTLAAGERRQVDYDLGALAPATLRGRVLLDGRPAAHRQVELVRTLATDAGGSGARAGTTVVDTDADGRFAARGVPPGRYHLAIPVQPGPGAGTVRLTSREVAEAEPGGEASAAFTLVSGALEVRVRDAGGLPLAGRAVAVTCREHGLLCRGATDRDGLLRLAPVPAGTYVVGLAGPPGAPAEVTVAGGEPASTCDLVVAAGERADGPAAQGR